MLEYRTKRCLCCEKSFTCGESTSGGDEKLQYSNLLSNI